MNHFLELKIHNKDRVVFVRPEQVAAIERRDDDPYEFLYLASGETFLIERGQVSLSTLINRNTHAGMRAL